MATIGLLALDRDFARVLWAALEEEGHTVTWITFGPDAVRRVAQDALDVLVLDGHEYVNVKAFLHDLRAQTQTARLPVVVLGPARPREVPAFPKVVKLGQRYDLHRLLEAIQGVLAARHQADLGKAHGHFS
jgi:CheY-like chemotaxis protein